MSLRYKETKAEIEQTQEAISGRQARRYKIENYIESLEKMGGEVTKFDPVLWGGLVDRVTVYSKEDIRFTMAGGMEIKI